MILLGIDPKIIDFEGKFLDVYEVILGNIWHKTCAEY